MSKFNAVARSHKIVELLAGNIEGFANRDIAETLKVSKVNISRDLAQLESLGYAVKRENGRWYLT